MLYAHTQLVWCTCNWMPAMKFLMCFSISFPLQALSSRKFTSHIMMFSHRLCDPISATRSSSHGSAYLCLVSSTRTQTTSFYMWWSCLYNSPLHGIQKQSLVGLCQGSLLWHQSLESRSLVHIAIITIASLSRLIIQLWPFKILFSWYLCLYLWI